METISLESRQKIENQIEQYKSMLFEWNATDEQARVFYEERIRISNREPEGPEKQFYLQLLNFELSCLIKKTPEFMKYQKEGAYPEKWWAYYHAIKLALGKESPFPNNFGKSEIIEYGRQTYNTGEGFYKTFMSIDINQTYSLVRSFNKRDRANFKKILTEISVNDADIVHFLNKLPN